eukprot:TRINITY_DN7901_c0_g1_i1.p2 TRINITY_DN7901_c0_g1~~TRINITY_DN7901_c0_g1_i1.p2  ORF type:complete len:100 (-),score=19.06 TRINITY_DN7901_c0_g1_i1:236-535(-)
MSENTERVVVIRNLPPSTSPSALTELCQGPVAAAWVGGGDGHATGYARFRSAEGALRAFRCCPRTVGGRTVVVRLVDIRVLRGLVDAAAAPPQCFKQIS